MPTLPPLTIDLFKDAATSFATALVRTPLPELYAVTDGKAVGTKVEAMFKHFLQSRYHIEVGNAANGLDFPSLNTDLKVTSLRQPQSSCPFKAATQKIYGLGYNLLVVVYVKTDVVTERAAYLDIRHVIYIDQSRTSDFTLTKQIRDIVHGMGNNVGGREATIEDLDALLQDKNVPLDEVSRRQLAERLVDDVPEQGVLTISNALQWRLQYGRAISSAVTGSNKPEVVDLRA
jgi:restriction system protein